MHGGATPPVFHRGEGVFEGLPNPVECTRYHSLAVERESLPECLEVTAWTEDGEIGYATARCRWKGCSSIRNRS